MSADQPVQQNCGQWAEQGEDEVDDHDTLETGGACVFHPDSVEIVRYPFGLSLEIDGPEAFVYEQTPAERDVRKVRIQRTRPMKNGTKAKANPATRAAQPARSTYRKWGVCCPDSGQRAGLSSGIAVTYSVVWGPIGF